MRADLMTDNIRKIVKASADEDEALLDILTEAFADDPMFQYIFGAGNDARLAFAPMVTGYRAHDHRFVNEPRSATAVYLPPNKKEKVVPGRGYVRKFIKQYGLAALIRSIRVMLIIKWHHPRYPHYYLWVVGTKHSARGKGVGSALLNHLKRLSDEAGVPAYLENSNPNNTAFYQSHGFEILREISFGTGTPSLLLMQREAKSPTPDRPQ